jgi:hypothetical protein
MAPIEYINEHGKPYPITSDEFSTIEDDVVLVAKKGSKNTLQLTGINYSIEPKSFEAKEQIVKGIVCINGTVNLGEKIGGSVSTITLADGAVIEVTPKFGRKIRYTYKAADSK